MDQIHYSKGYKYQLRKDYTIKTDICADDPLITTETPLITLTPAGQLTIRKFYSWDGPSGPTIDSRNFMRGALLHDAYYQLMRMGKLSRANRGKVDLLLRQICVEDGMSRLRAWYVYRGVKRFAAFAASAKNVKKIFVAGR